MKFYFITILFCLGLLTSCSTGKPKHVFGTYAAPAAPDYSNINSWAALPQMLDAADSVPSGLKNIQHLSQADVFFVYPTSFLNGRKNKQWNAAIDNEIINSKTDGGAILYQSSLFNGVGKVYAPRYRQAHLHAFFSIDTSSSRKALELAYADVRASFQYYLQKYNNKRPIILAGHSQGALHLIWLLKEFFDEKELSNKLVVAYVVGWPVAENAFKKLSACKTPTETNCICSWRTFKKGYDASFIDEEDPILVTNPLNWTTEKNNYIGKKYHRGAVLDDISKPPVSEMVGAEIYKGILWVDKPKFKGSFFYPFSNFHRGDFNIFYVDVRENAKQRLNAFWRN